MEPQNCYVCNNTSVFYSRNLFKTKSKYSETRICELIRKFLGNYPSEREYESICCDVNDYCVCIECLNKIDEYDLATMTAKRVETELRDLLLHTEAAFYRDSKTNLTEELFLSPIETIDALDHSREDDYESNGEIGTGEPMSDIDSEKAESSGDEYIPPGSKELPHYLMTKSERELGNRTEKRKYKCQKCNMEFKSVSALARHKPAKTLSSNNLDVQSNTYSCKKCTEMFCTRSQYEHHQKQHKDEDVQFKCIHCCFDLKEKSALDDHLKLHEDQSPLHCVVCNKLFPKRCGLVRHMRIHSGLHFFQCHRCGKGFIHKSSFEVHLMAHDDIREKKCPHCDQKFRSTSHLNRHLRIHTGSKPFSCPVCSRKFAQRYNMGVHLRLHDSSSNQPKLKRKTYICNFCNSSFARQSKLDEHLEKSHEAVIPHTNIGNSLEDAN